jgi:hypothetical protein
MLALHLVESLVEQSHSEGTSGVRKQSSLIVCWDWSQLRRTVPESSGSLLDSPRRVQLGNLLNDAEHVFGG